VDYGLQLAVYGDIDIESHKAWEVKVSTAAGQYFMFYVLFCLSLTTVPVSENRRNSDKCDQLMIPSFLFLDFIYEPIFIQN
jgi:hypothetical protein